MCEIDDNKNHGLLNKIISRLLDRNSSSVKLNNKQIFSQVGVTYQYILLCYFRDIVN